MIINKKTINIMKARFLILLLPLVWTLAGCGDTKETACQEYAPADAHISLTDYNTVNDVYNYFDCHDSTLKAHIGDTLKLEGWVYWGDPQEEYYLPYIFEDSDELPGRIVLTDNENHYGSINDVKMTLHFLSPPDDYEYFSRKFMQDRERYLHKKLYVTGKLVADKGSYPFIPPKCCSYVSIIVTDFDTIPN